MTSTIFAVAITIALCGLVGSLVLILREHRAAEERWTEERRELLNRIQRPDILPTRPAENFVVPDREPDEWNKVGTIELDMNGSDDGAG